MEIHFVSSVDSPEFGHLTDSLTRSSVVGLDAEWRPTRSSSSTVSSGISPFPTVALLQIACRVTNESAVVFLLDLLALPLPAVYGVLKDLFESPDVLKLGFRFKQDLIYLSATFCGQGCEPGFDRMEPFLDITTIYSLLHPNSSGRRSKDTKSLATICRDLLGISLSKELQCSDWSCRPLTDDQKSYAAADAFCLMDIFTKFQLHVTKGENTFPNSTTLPSPATSEILEGADMCDDVLNLKLSGGAHSDNNLKEACVDMIITTSSTGNINPNSGTHLTIVTLYGEKILLDESTYKCKASKRRNRQPSNGAFSKTKFSVSPEGWQGPPPWDPSLGGDGCPKFLCDVMVEGLAKHLRCVGLDAAVPNKKKPEARELIDQAYKEKRVLLTRDSKLLRHDYLISGQIYRINSLLKNDQLLEVIETFQLKINEDRLMSRCTKCNGSFIQKPLSTEEAVEAAKGFQKIPNCLYKKDIEFWQCRDCNQLYWEGTQYHNAVQKFIDVCKLNE